MENDIAKKKIIVADDDPGIRDIVRLILQKHGYDITVYSTADQLLEKKFDTPDLFLLDKQLPGMDGLELCRHLQNDIDTCDVPVIMLSATPQIQEIARRAGATDALEKPFEIRQLRDIVKKYIG